MKHKQSLFYRAKRCISTLLVVSLLASYYLPLASPVYAASSPWSQTDWSGGGSQAPWSDETKYDSSSNVTTSTAGQVTLTAWTHRRKITFDNSAQAENLTNFPVLVKLNSSRIDYADTQNSGQDIRFTDPDGTSLPYEIEVWNEAGDSFVWVKIPQIDASSNTDFIYMYYGNPSAADAQNKTAVWNSDFVAVWHLGESGNGTAGEYVDSTSTANNGQGGLGTATAVPTQVTGAIGSAQSLDGGDFIAFADTNFPVGTSPRTMSAWMNTGVYNTGAVFTYGLNLNGQRYSIEVRSPNWIVTAASGGAVGTTDTPSTGQWVLATVSFTGTNLSDFKLYLNGVEKSLSLQAGAFVGINTPLTGNSQIGINVARNANFYTGLVDELRVSTGVRSASWIAADYKSQADTFASYGSEETISSGTVTSSIFDTESVSGAAWGILSYNATVPANTSVAVKVRSSDSSSMTDASDFSACPAVASGSDISSNTCITDGDRYIQYQITLSNTDGSSIPTFEDISIGFSLFDDTGPTLELNSPANNAYTSDNRPTFRWKKATDALSTIAQYDFIIDNPSAGADKPSGDFTISGIPASRTTDYETNKYLVHYENFDDAEINNDYISLYTKSSSEWAASENNGELREGAVTWKVRATDSIGNTTEGSRTLFVDRTPPTVAFTQINSVPFSGTDFATTDTTPTIFGKITDPLAGSDTSNTQTEYGPKAASGPKQVEIKIEKKEGLSYAIHTLYTLQTDTGWFTCTDREITDKSKQTCNKFAPFEYISKVALVPGIYKITATGRDTVDNIASETSFTLAVVSATQIAQEKTIVGGGGGEESREITKPLEPGMLEIIIKQLMHAGEIIITAVSHVVNTIANSLSHELPIALNWVAERTLFIASTIERAIASTISASSTLAKSVVPFLQNSLLVLVDTTGNIAIGLSAFTIEMQHVMEKTTSTANQGFFVTTSSLAQIVSTATNLITLTASQISDMYNATTTAYGVVLQKQLIIAARTINLAAASINDGYTHITNTAPHAIRIALLSVQDTSTAVSLGATTAFTTLSRTVNETAASVTLALQTGEQIETSARATTNRAIALTAHDAQHLFSAAISSIDQRVKKIEADAEKATVLLTVRAIESAPHAIRALTRANTMVTDSVTWALGATREGLSEIAFRIGEKTQDISDTAGIAIIKFTYNFVSEPTTISDVKADTLSATSVKISWTTNHPANGKVNWGYEEGIYEFEKQTDKRTTYHEFTLTNLTPGTEYNYEVMSHNKNYVYDANRKFITPKE